MKPLFVSVGAMRHLVKHAVAKRKMAYMVWWDKHHEDLWYINSGFVKL